MDYQNSKTTSLTSFLSSSLSPPVFFHGCIRFFLCVQQYLYSKVHKRCCMWAPIIQPRHFIHSPNQRTPTVQPTKTHKHRGATTTTTKNPYIAPRFRIRINSRIWHNIYISYSWHEYPFWSILTWWIDGRGSMNGTRDKTHHINDSGFSSVHLGCSSDRLWCMWKEPHKPRAMVYNAKLPVYVWEGSIV